MATSVNESSASLLNHTAKTSRQRKSTQHQRMQVHHSNQYRRRVQLSQFNQQVIVHKAQLIYRPRTVNVTTRQPLSTGNGNLQLNGGRDVCVVMPRHRYQAE